MKITLEATGLLEASISLICSRAPMKMIKQDVELARRNRLGFLIVEHQFKLATTM